MSPDDRLIVQEVAPRDGLQIEPKWVATEDKVKLIDSLSRLDFGRIEVSSFVSAKAVPALRDAEDVFRRITRKVGITYVALVPNLRGAQNALRAQADELNMVMSVSETHNRANMGMSGAASFEAFRAIADMAADSRVTLNGTIATAFGCPFEGVQAQTRVLELVEAYLALGVDGITLADTTGMANPRQVRRFFAMAREALGADVELTAHFHNTRGQGLANVLAALEAGVESFESSFGELGGCPVPAGATGNIATEDLVSMLHEMGISTGIDLPALIACSRRAQEILGRPLGSHVLSAGPVDWAPQ